MMPSVPEKHSFYAYHPGANQSQQAANSALSVACPNCKASANQSCVLRPNQTCVARAVAAGFTNTQTFVPSPTAAPGLGTPGAAGPVPASAQAQFRVTD